MLTSSALCIEILYRVSCIITLFGEVFPSHLVESSVMLPRTLSSWLAYEISLSALCVLIKEHFLLLTHGLSCSGKDIDNSDMPKRIPKVLPLIAGVVNIHSTRWYPEREGGCKKKPERKTDELFTQLYWVILL